MEKPPITIALVDNNLNDRAVFRTLLQQNGFDVILEAENGLDFLNKLSGIQGKIPKLCIIDVLMPVMDGIETSREICNRYPSVIIICISVVNDPKIIGKAIENGAHHFLPKGMPCKQFVNTLRELLSPPSELGEAT